MPFKIQDSRISNLNVEIQTEYDEIQELALEWKESIDFIEKSTTTNVTHNDDNVCKAVPCVIAQPSADQMILQCVFCLNIFHSFCEGKYFGILNKLF